MFNIHIITIKILQTLRIFVFIQALPKTYEMFYMLLQEEGVLVNNYTGNRRETSK